MKFYDTKGREHKIDIRPSRWKRKAVGEGKGLFQSKVGELLAHKYVGEFVLEEFPIPGENLRLDFFLPRRKLAVEVQGTQHYEFNAFFHEDKYAFQASQQRDKRKVKWCELNGINLIKVDWGIKEEIILNLLP